MQKLACCRRIARGADAVHFGPSPERRVRQKTGNTPDGAAPGTLTRAGANPMGWS